MLINCVSLGPLLNVSELLMSVLFCEPLLPEWKSIQIAFCIHLELFQNSKVHWQCNVGCSRYTKNRKRNWGEYNGKFKYGKFSAPFMVIILCFSSKHLQALYTYYVVQAKSWGVGIPPTSLFPEGNQRMNCALPLGRSVSSFPSSIPSMSTVLGT